MILDARQETDTPTDTSAGNHEARDRHTQTDIRARKQADSIAYAHAVSHMNDWKLQSPPILVMLSIISAARYISRFQLSMHD